MTGEPRVIAGQTTASADDVLAVTLSPQTANVGELMARMLAAFTDPAVLFYCAALDTLVGSTDAATIELLTDLFNADTGGALVITPADTYGMARRFAVVSDTLNDAPLASQLANDYQRRTLSGLVNLADNYRYKQGPAFARYDCFVSQFTAQVAFKLSDGTIAAALPSLPASGQTIAIKLTSPPRQNKAMFE